MENVNARRVDSVRLVFIFFVLAFFRVVSFLLRVVRRVHFKSQTDELQGEHHLYEIRVRRGIGNPEVYC
jgi:hypothetical protein